MDHDTLSGVTALVTRPEPQAGDLAQAILAAGGNAITFPVVDIVADDACDDSHIAKIEAYDYVIFVSQNAVRYASQIQKQLMPLQNKPLVATVGNTTANQLQHSGLQADIIAPKPYNSESLLSTPEFEACEDARILLVKGHGGREFLKMSLEGRGALVDELKVYRRRHRHYDGLPSQMHDTNIIIATSNDILQAIWNILVKDHNQKWILNIPLIVFSQRQCHLAAELGFTETPIIAQSAENKAILLGIAQWRMSQHDTKEQTR